MEPSKENVTEQNLETSFSGSEKFTKNYKQFRVVNQTIESRRRWTDEYLLSEYTHLMDGLIGRLDGTIPLHTEEKDSDSERGPADAVIWLDKSARPVSWMKRKLWSIIARKSGTDYDATEIPRQPDDYYLNIDKEYWLQMMGVPPEDVEDPPPGSIDISKIPREYITRIRALFIDPQVAKITEENLEDAWKYPTILKGKHVVIVDEVKSGGSTLKISKLLLREALREEVDYENPEVSGIYWAVPDEVVQNGGIRDKNGRIPFAREWMPVWYHPKHASGRGVGDRDQKYPEKVEEAGFQANEMSKIGRFVLSTPPHHLATYERTIDTQSLEIREDIDQMGKDILSKKIFYRPSERRLRIGEYDDFIRRAERLNGISFEEWKETRDHIIPKQPK